MAWDLVRRRLHYYRYRNGCRLRKGIDIAVIMKEECKHHPYAVIDVNPIINFIGTWNEGLYLQL